MLLDYVIITLSEIKTTKGVMRGEGVPKMFLHDYGGWGEAWPCNDRR